MMPTSNKNQAPLASSTPIWCSAGYYKTIGELAKNRQAFLTDTFDMEQRGFCISNAVAKPAGIKTKPVTITYKLSNIPPRMQLQAICAPGCFFLTCAEPTGPMPNYEGKELAWVKAKDLKPGTQLVANDIVITVESVKPCETEEDMYFLDMEDENFTIDGGAIVGYP